MPAPQVAVVQTYAFGAAGSGTPAAANKVLEFDILKGGKLEVDIINDDSAALTITAQVSADGTTYTAIDATKNGAVLAAVSVAAHTRIHRTWYFSAPTDARLRFLATGNVKGEIQIRGDDILQTRTI
jgi:hypothetical protein